jgi:hypothetical protein
MRQLLCLALGALFASAACGGAPPEATPSPAQPSIEAPSHSVDPLSSELLRRHGLHPAGPTQFSSVRIGPPREGWDIVLEESRKIGLDFASLTGTNVQMRTTPVVGNLGPQHDCAGCSKGGRVHVLVAEERIVGAWLSDKVTVPGVYALSDAARWCSDDVCDPSAVPVPEPPLPRSFGPRYLFTPVASVPPDAIPPGPAIEDYRATTGGVLVTRPPDVVEYGIAECPADDPECFGTRDEATVWLVQWEYPEQDQWLTLVVDASTGKMLTALGGLDR